MNGDRGLAQDYWAAKELARTRLGRKQLEDPADRLAKAEQAVRDIVDDGPTTRAVELIVALAETAPSKESLYLLRTSVLEDARAAHADLERVVLADPTSRVARVLGPLLLD